MLVIWGDGEDCADDLALMFISASKARRSRILSCWMKEEEDTGGNATTGREEAIVTVSA